MLAKNNLSSFSDAQAQMAEFIAGYRPSRATTRFEIKVQPVDMLGWLSVQKADVKIYGANQADTMSIAGIGEAACVSGKRIGSYRRIFKQLRDCLNPQYPYLQWYGGFCFDDRNQDGGWKDFGAYRFVLPRFELAAQEGRMIFCCNLRGREDIPELLKQLKAIKPAPANRRKSDFSITRRKDFPGRLRWQKNIESVLKDSSVQKVVLARKTLLTFKQAPDCFGMLRQLKAVTPNSYHFAFQFQGTCFLGASPERLYRRYQRLIESEALAGTMPKSANPKSLQNSAKNQREHALVVDAINLCFKGMCAGFRCDSTPGVLTLPNGHHLITKFQGQLKDGINDEDILKLLHPTPALGGCPRPKALDLIRRLEGFSRGWYAAPVGFVGLDWAEFVVGIRSGLSRGRHLSVYAGAGIVDGSEPRAEWNEVENKISNFIKIIR